MLESTNPGRDIRLAVSCLADTMLLVVFALGSSTSSFDRDFLKEDNAAVPFLSAVSRLSGI